MHIHVNPRSLSLTPLSVLTLLGWFSKKYFCEAMVLEYLLEGLQQFWHDCYLLLLLLQTAAGTIIMSRFHLDF